jgi:hypothetical protein
MLFGFFRNFITIIITGDELQKIRRIVDHASVLAV